MKSPFKIRRSGRGALLTITALFVASAIVRISDGMGVAIAREVSELSEIAAPKSCAPPPDIDALLTSVTTRNEEIDALERSLMERQRTVEIAEEQIALRLMDLQQAEESLKATLTIADQGAESDLDRLTSVYESMKPKQAAELFAAMAPEFAAGFLGRMRPDAAASVMAGLEPETAYQISVILAGRNAGAPKE